MQIDSQYDQAQYQITKVNTFTTKDKDKEVTPQQQAKEKKILIGKIIIVCLAVGCFSMVVFILTKASKYFGYMFTLDTETIIKKYVRQYYKSYMASLYFSIFGLVISVADAILLFFKFSQKNKLVWFHALYYLGFFICGIVALTNSDYDSRMKGMQGLLISNPICTSAYFTLECYLSTSYLQYKSSFIIFFIIFSLFFVFFTVIYHYIVVYLLVTELEPKNVKGQSKANIFNANQNNETFVSEMLDEHGN